MLKKIEISTNKFPLQNSEDPYLRELGILLGSKLRNIISMEAFEREQVVLMFKYKVIDEFAFQEPPLPPTSHIKFKNLSKRDKDELSEDAKERIKQDHNAWETRYDHIVFRNRSGLEWLFHYLKVAEASSMVREAQYIRSLIEGYPG